MAVKGLCLIVSGGEYCEIPEETRGAEYVIACDRGYRHARCLGLTPDVVIGDFDSAPRPEASVPVLSFPPEKDDTDTMLAVRHALEKGYRDIAICCALGGRLDHAFANLQSAAFIASRGGQARLLGRDTDILVFSGGGRRFPRREGWSLSVFALSDTCTGVTVRGTEYQCRSAALTNSFPLGVSNAWASDDAEIYVETGVLMVVQSGLGGEKL